MSYSLQRVYIQNFEELGVLCKQLQKASLIAIDTEFVRTRTLYPKLGLLQVNDGKTLALIDPVTIDDLSPFWELLTDSNIRKVIHACNEDLEVFLTSGNCKPANLIDSQIMMSFLGHGLSVGYAAMVKHYEGIELDKSESRTDWTKRPLTERQLTYAQADVEHLFNLFPKLEADLKKTPWMEIAQEETERLIVRKYLPTDTENLYRGIKMSWKLSPAQLSVLQHLTKWRYQQAQARDLPISFIAKDHTLFNLAYRLPESLDQMRKIEGVEYMDIKHKGKALLKVLQEAKKTPEAQYPEKLIRLDEYKGYKEAFKKVKAFVVNEAQKLDLAVENLASKKQINAFLCWHLAINGMQESISSVDILNGWRGKLLGEKLQAFADKHFPR